jgi:dTMP kinase
LIPGGVFVSFEGIDGSGKSTQARMLADHLRGAGREVVLTREPGGSPGAEEIRALLLTGGGDRWSPQTELLLFTAARRDHVERTVAPALARGAVVLCDRFVDSPRAYQAAGRGAEGDLVETLHRRVIALDPDLTLILDLEPVAAAARAAARGGAEARFERFGIDFQRRLRAGFAAIAEAEPGRCAVIDAEGDAEDVAARVAAAVATRLPDLA